MVDWGQVISLWAGVKRMNTQHLDPLPPLVVTASPRQAGGLRRLAGLLLSLVILAGAAWYAHAYQAEVAWWIRVFLAVLLVFVVAVLLLYLVRAGLALVARLKLEREYLQQERERTAESQLTRLKTEAELQEARARARKAEQEAEYAFITAKRDEAVFVRDSNPQAIWKPLHLNPRHRVNGLDNLPSPLEIATWQQWQGAGPQLSAPAAPQISLPGGAVLPERIDLPELFNGRGSLRNIILGVRVDENGLLRTVSAPLERMVHIGAAGATDSGKSNFGRMIATQVILAREDVSLVFVDLKETTFKIFRDVPRRRYPIITDPQDFAEMMRDLYGELQRRKQLFGQYLTVETLVDYNRLAELSLPRIVVFVDEVTNLFMTTEVRQIALRMVRESRAFGINFIDLGQSWSHKEMDTSFREQHRTTGHFATNNPYSSRMMIHRPDAVNISVPGRAYFLLPFGMAREVVEIQTPYLDPTTALHLLPAETASAPAPPPASAPLSEAELADELTEQETRVLEKWDTGERRISVIAEYAYGGKGGKQNQWVKEVLARRERLDLPDSEA